MKYIIIHEKDNVAVALQDLKAGDNTVAPGVTLACDIPKGHKFALSAIKAGSDVVKYGFPIGYATGEISKGDWVHTHNIKTKLAGVLDYTYHPAAAGGKKPAAESTLRFNGYLRENGEAGIRNEIWIINTVGCINKSCENIAALCREHFKHRKGIDGFYTFNHPYGCSQLGEDMAYTQKLLAALVNHPNAGGVLVVGLGCENNHLGVFKSFIGETASERVKFLELQQSQDEEGDALNLIAGLVDYAEQCQRQPLPVSLLKIGVKCGGSDGLSGITANPLVGAVTDMFVAEGATVLQTEVPEMFGAETIFMDRAVDEVVFQKIVHLVNGFKEYFIRYHQEVYENPSPGNKEGGITTLEDKSLGCTQKGGSSLVSDVLGYGERSVKKGLNLLMAPGNDLVSVTALVGAGAHMVLFTTGRGTPFGGAAPTVKIATNSELAEKKPHWIDFNAGVLAEGETIGDVKKALFDYVIQVAEGLPTNNEKKGFREIAIFKDGVTL